MSNNRQKFEDTQLGIFLKNAPKDIKEIELLPLLSRKDISQLSQTSKSSNTLFQPLLDADKLLQYLVKGEIGKAEEILGRKPELALKRANATDHSKREFANITVLQWALWALDSNAWKMIRKYINSEEAAAQLNEFELKGVTYKFKDKLGNISNTTENHYSFGIIDALKHHSKNYMSWDSTTEMEHWKKTVGHEQTLATPDIATHYCDSKFSIYPIPVFTNEKISTPTFTIQNKTTVKDQQWFPLSTDNNEVIGKDIAIERGINLKASGRPSDSSMMPNSVFDYYYLNALKNARLKEYAELVVDLKNTSGHSKKQKRS